MRRLPLSPVVVSATHSWFGASARKSRQTRSGAAVCSGFCLVEPAFQPLPRNAPCRPRCRMIRSTRLRPTLTPWRRSASHTRGEHRWPRTRARRGSCRSAPAAAHPPSAAGTGTPRESATRSTHDHLRVGPISAAEYALAARNTALTRRSSATSRPSLRFSSIISVVGRSARSPRSASSLTDPVPPRLRMNAQLPGQPPDHRLGLALPPQPHRALTQLLRVPPGCCHDTSSLGSTTRSNLVRKSP